MCRIGWASIDGHLVRQSRSENRVVTFWNLDFLDLGDLVGGLRDENGGGETRMKVEFEKERDRSRETRIVVERRELQ